MERLIGTMRPWLRRTAYLILGAQLLSVAMLSLRGFPYFGSDLVSNAPLWESPVALFHLPGITITEKRLTPAELEAADEVFITSTTRNLLPVAEIEGRKIGRADATRHALAEAFGQFVDRYVAESKAAKV